MGWFSFKSPIVEGPLTTSVYRVVESVAFVRRILRRWTQPYIFFSFLKFPYGGNKENAPALIHTNICNKRDGKITTGNPESKRVDTNYRELQDPCSVCVGGTRRKQRDLRTGGPQSRQKGLTGKHTGEASLRKAPETLRGFAYSNSQLNVRRLL